MAEDLAVDMWEQLVHSPEFDNECRAQSQRLSSSSSSGSNSSERSKLWEQDDDSSSLSSVESSHAVSKLEAHLYYFGIRGRRQRGPKLIYRTSTDVFMLPFGLEHDPRIMQLLPVYDHDKLAQDDLWATIRTEVVNLLDSRRIQLTSVDLVRFRWEEQKEDGRSDMFTTRVTIWVGVQTDTLTSDIAYESSRDILQLLEEHGISDLDVAYRESVAKFLDGPGLSAPVDNFHPLKDVIDPITTALGMPIAGLKTPYMQGTLGFFFRVDDALYGVTARHVLFPEEGGNLSYSYIAGPKKKVVLMGNQAFDNFLSSIMAQIGTLSYTLLVLEKQVATYRKRTAAGSQEVASKLARSEADMHEKNTAIEELKMFFGKMKREWSELNDRVIGYVVWAPPISVFTPPHGYTKDVCVIKLDEKKFWPNFKGNVIDLGPEIESGKFISLMYARFDVPSEFDYPEDRLFKLGAILSATQIATPNSKDRNNDPARFVIKRGLTSRTTVGRLTGFESFVRHYRLLGNLDSIEAAIYSYDNDSGPFSRRGDSGALIAATLAEFTALLTSGTGPTDSSDITYGTPIFWLWNNVIKAQYPGGNLYFDIPET